MNTYVWGIIILAICFTAFTRNLKKWILDDISSLSYFIITSCFTTMTALIYLLASGNLNNFVKDFISDDYKSKEEYNKKFVELRKKYKFNPKKTDLLRTYRNLLETQQIKENSSFYKFSIWFF